MELCRIFRTVSKTIDARMGKGLPLKGKRDENLSRFSSRDVSTTAGICSRAMLCPS